MIKITLSPVFTDKYEDMEINVTGDLVVINGESFDFTDLQNGYHIDSIDIESQWFSTGAVYKDESGDMTMTIKFPHPYDAGVDMKFPETILVTKDGFVELPKYTPPVVIEHITPEVNENEEIGLLEIEADTNPDGIGSVGDTTIVEDLPSGD